MLFLCQFFIFVLSFLIGFYYFFNLILIFLGWLLIEQEKKSSLLRIKRWPQISILIPAYNEEKVILKTLRFVLNQKYPKFEVIIINDGSTDRTLSLLRRELDLHKTPIQLAGPLYTRSIKGVYRSALFPSLFVLDKENGGKADALNAGLNMASSDLVMILDADVQPEEHALFYLVEPFLKDKRVVAAGGQVRIKNKGNIIEKFQALEYIRSFALFRLGWSFLNLNLIIAGAFGLFRKQIIQALGGFRRFAIGEDMEIILRLHEYYRSINKSYRIIQVARALCFTGAPQNIKELARQRIRWHKGLLSTLRVYWHLLLNPRFGALAVLALPYFWIYEVFLPFLEFIGYFLIFFFLKFGLWSDLWIFLLALIGGSYSNSLMALGAEYIGLRLYRNRKSWLDLFLAAFWEPLFYHQLNIWWKIKATWQFVTQRQIKTGWRPPTRSNWKGKRYDV